jgi:hypothetical protein
LSLFFQELSRRYCSFHAYTKQLNSLLWIIFFFSFKTFCIYYETEIQFWFEYSERAVADLVFDRTRVGDVATGVPSASSLYGNKK